MVPNGWEVKKLENVVSRTRKITYGIVVPGPYEPNGNLMIRAKDYSFGWQPIESIYRVSDKMHQSYKRSQVRKGDVLLTIVGSIGNTAIVPEDLEGANITQQTARLSFDEHDANFFYSIMSSRIGKKEIYRYAKSGVQPSLNLADIAKFKVPVPPLPEQQKIAKILSTWDKAISTTERLIHNSTQQKKALMQQLLTGKKRLLDDSGKRFEGEWEEVTLEQAVKYRRGSFPQPYGNPAWIDEINGYPFVQVYDIDKNMKLKPDTKIKISDAAIDKSVFIPKGTIIVSLQGSIGRVAITQYDAYVDRTILLFQEFLIPMNKVFFAYIIQELFDIEKTKAPGGTIKTITKAVLSNFKVLIPSLEEQQKIATVLTNADKDIELLGQQLADLQKEKKALMQQLLTGKKRVVVDGEVA